MRNFYNKLIIISCLLLFSGVLNSQTTITINSGATLTADYHSGPIYRSSATSSYRYSQFAYLYNASELSSLSGGSTLTKLAWNKTNVGATSISGKFKIYLKNSAVTSYTSATSFSSLIGGATLVYDNTSQNIPATTGFLDFILNTPFVYTGGSLEIMVDWSFPGGSSTAAFNWEKTTVASSILGYASSAAITTNLSTTSNSIGTLTNTRPTIQMTFTQAAACSGAPTGGTAVSNATSPICSGIPVSLSVTGSTTGVSGLSYQWESSSDNLTWGNITSATNSILSSTITSNTWYRRKITCSGIDDYSTSVQVLFNPATYASLPFSESFENTWIDGCGATGSQSIPNVNWRNTPVTGNNSWRRNDETTTNSGWSSTSGAYSPTFSAGAYSARIHTYSTSTPGSLDLYLDCNSGAATKQLSYDYINTSGSDSLKVFLSIDGGSTFNFIGTKNTTTTTWSNCLFRNKCINSFAITDVLLKLKSLNISSTGASASLMK